MTKALSAEKATHLWNRWSLIELILVASGVSGILYFLYFKLAPWIWRQNIHFQPAELTPWILEHTAEHDGVETYALYILSFTNIFCAFITTRLAAVADSSKLRLTQYSMLTVIASIYIAHIGFIPPMCSLNGPLPLKAVLQGLAICAIMMLLVLLVRKVHQRSPGAAIIILAILLIPVCFIATAPVSRYDYSYIFAPALRLINGAPLSEIYFQYDLFISLIAAAWMKLGLDLNGFLCIGQAGYYAALIAVFLVSRKLFQDKDLSLLLIAALVLARIYSTPWDVVLCFQVTPFRLDLWILLIALLLGRGPFHWSIGLLCGILIIFHKTFGIIYCFAYLQLLITLQIIEFCDRDRSASLSFHLLKFAKVISIPLAFMSTSWLVGLLIFWNDAFRDYSGYYMTIGIGFMQITAISFYWYVFPVLSMVFIMLIKLRHSLPPRYLAAGFLLIYCAIGNSIYFFGRSHENNILNIAIVLIFVLFLLFDLVARGMNGGDPMHTAVPAFARLRVWGPAVATIAVLSVYYSPSIAQKVVTQFANAAKGQFIYPEDLKFQEDAIRFSGAIRMATGDSEKVYFVGGKDFDMCYYGGFKPMGFCNPFTTWIFSNDLNTYLPVACSM